MIESELQHNSERTDGGDKGMDDSAMAMTDGTSIVSKMSLTPTKRPHVVDLSLPETQNNFTKSGPSSDVVSDMLEPITKRKRNMDSKELEAEKRKEAEEIWCNKCFVVSKLDGHNDVICSLDCNQDLLLTGSRDTSLKVWSLHTLEMLHHMGGHTGVVTCVQLVPASADFHEEITDHGFVVGLSGSLDCSVKMWNLDAGQLICSVYVFSPITCMDYWCGSKVVIGTEGGKVDIWDVKNGENVCTVRCSTAKSKPVTCLKVFKDHVYCADDSVQKWQLGPNNHASLLLDTAHMISSRKSSNTIRCFCIHDNSIYWGDNGVNLKVCNSLTGVVKKYPSHSGKHVVTGAVAVISNDVILCAGYNEDQGTSYINVHSLCDGKHITTLSNSSTEYITCMASLEGTTSLAEGEAVMMPSSGSNNFIRLVTGGNNAELKVWDMISSNVSQSDKTLQSLSLKSYQHKIQTSTYSPPSGEYSCDTDSSIGSDKNCSTQGDIEIDIDLHNQPLPIPRSPQPTIKQDSSWWCSII